MTLSGNGTELEQVAQEIAEKQLSTVQSSVQDRAAIETEYERAMPILFGWATQYDETPPWWTPSRDKWLREFWKTEPLLSGAVYTVQSKIKTTGWTLKGPDKTVQRYESLLGNAEFGKGWGEFISRVTEEVLTQDNGGWIELLGGGDPRGPIEGPVLGLAQLDAAQVYRTGNLEYPVVYHSPLTGRRHLMHTSRVANITSMPSPKEDMYGVGFCAVSRVLVAAKILKYIEEFKQEKLGGRPHRALIRSQGYNAKQVREALKESEVTANAKGLLRYMPATILASYDPGVETALEVVDLASLPDGYNERETTDIYWDILAACFGVDRNEFAPIRSGQLGSGQQSSIQAEKAKGKGVAEIYKQIERFVNWNILPESTTFEFDNPYDEDDLNEAELKSKIVTWIRAAGAPDTVGQTPLTVDQQRQLMADHGIIPDDWLPKDLTQAISRTDVNRPQQTEEQQEQPLTKEKRGALQEVLGLLKETLNRMKTGEKARTDTPHQNMNFYLRAPKPTYIAPDVHITTPKPTYVAPDVHVNVPQTKVEPRFSLKPSFHVSLPGLKELGVFIKGLTEQVAQAKPPEVKVTNILPTQKESAAPVVNVTVPTPEVKVENIVHLPHTKTTHKKVTRDFQGKMDSVIETEKYE